MAQPADQETVSLLRWLRRQLRQPTPEREAGNLFTRLAHRVAASKAVDSLFHAHSWYVAPPPPPPAPVVVVKPPPPTAPPLPFTVMGSYAHPGEATVYFLTRGDRVFTTIPLSTFREQAGASTRAPSTSTTQTRQALIGVSVSR